MVKTSHENARTLGLAFLDGSVEAIADAVVRLTANGGCLAVVCNTVGRAQLDGVSGPDELSQLGRLGAQLILQRAVEDEMAAFLGRARYERTPEAAGSRHGHRPRRVQTAEGEITIAMPQGRDTLTRFVSSVIPDTRAIVRTRPLEALVIGAYVRGLSDRDIESLAREAGLGTISRTAVSGICRELHDRYRAFRARSLGEVRLLALFLDAIYLPVRPEGPREGVLVAWGFTTDGARVLLDVCLGQRERTEDWLDLGRGLAARGLRSPLLVVSDGAPGLIRAITELWPDADRGRCAVHRLVSGHRARCGVRRDCPRTEGRRNADRAAQPCRAGLRPTRPGSGNGCRPSRPVVPAQAIPMSGMRGPQSARPAKCRPGGAGRSGQAIMGIVRSRVPGPAPTPRSRASPRATCGRRAPEGRPLRACGGRGCQPASPARDIELVGGDVHLLAPDVDLDRRERDALEVGEGLERLAISPVRPVEPALDVLGRHHALREAGGRTAVGEIGLEAADRHVPRGEADERRRAEPGELGARPLESPADGKSPEPARRARADEALLRLLGDVTAEAAPPPLIRIE